jgi:hypothetical protein
MNDERWKECTAILCKKLKQEFHFLTRSLDPFSIIIAINKIIASLHLRDTVSKASWEVSEEKEKLW